MLKIKQFLSEIKTVEDIKEKATNILNKAANQEPSQFTQLVDPSSEMFMRVIFMFHPTRSAGLNDMEESKIFVG
jgi:hypothetical protein